MRIEDVLKEMKNRRHALVKYEEKSFYVVFVDEEGFYHAQSIYNYEKIKNTSIVAKAIPIELLVANLKRVCASVGVRYMSHSGEGGAIRITYECQRCGEVNETRYNHIQQGHGCPACAGIKVHSLEFVRQQFIAEGLELLSGEYKNAHMKLTYRCLKHADEIQRITWNNFERGKRCPRCAIERRKGKGNVMWMGGVTPIYGYLRSHLKPWRKASFEASNGLCAVTELPVGMRYVIHHLRSFNSIYQEVFAETGIEVKPELSDYTDVEIGRLKEGMHRKHMELLGAVITPDIHDLFHRVYGKGENTPEQFADFKDRWKRGEFV